jgi:hypothetical protein
MKETTYSLLSRNPNARLVQLRACVGQATGIKHFSLKKLL